MNSWMIVTIALLSLCFVGAYSQQKPCTPKPINAYIVLDLSGISDATDMSDIRKAAIDVESILPDNSHCTLAVIERNKTRIIGQLEKKGSSSKAFEQRIYNFNGWKTDTPNAKFSTVKSMQLIESKYADIVFMIGGGLVEYDDPERWLPWKTYVIHVKDKPSTWDELASDEDHVIRPSELSKDTARLKALLCDDSGLLCDTDQYMPSFLKSCDPCDEICKPGGSLKYCSDVCKYFRPPVTTTTVPPTPVTTTTVPPTPVDSPDSALKAADFDPLYIVIIVSIGGVILLLTMIICLCWSSLKIRQTCNHVFNRVCLTKQQKRNVETPPKVIIPESIALAEEGAAVDSASEETTPLKCDSPASNEDIVNVVEENHQVLDYTVDLGTKTRLENTQSTTLQGR